MGESLFDENGNLNTGAYEPIYNGVPAAAATWREKRAESKEGRIVFSGKDLTDKRRDRLPVYALILGILSIFCVFFTNGYLISVLGLLIDAHALNRGTKRMTLAAVAAVCCCLAILLYIVCVAAKPLLSDMGWYMNLMHLVDRIFYYTR
jgi:hypothetical protein